MRTGWSSRSLNIADNTAIQIFIATKIKVIGSIA